MIVRRLRLGQAGGEIARDLGVTKKTVTKYRAWARQAGLLDRALPSAGDMQTCLVETMPVVPPPESPSKAERWRERIRGLRRRGVECWAILGILKEQHGFTGSYSSVYRLVQRLEPKTPEAFVRVY